MIGPYTILCCLKDGAWQSTRWGKLRIGWQSAMAEELQVRAVAAPENMPSELRSAHVYQSEQEIYLKYPGARILKLLQVVWQLCDKDLEASLKLVQVVWQFGEEEENWYDDLVGPPQPSHMRLLAEEALATNADHMQLLASIFLATSIQSGRKTMTEIFKGFRSFDLEKFGSQAHGFVTKWSDHDFLVNVVFESQLSQGNDKEVTLFLMDSFRCMMRRAGMKAVVSSFNTISVTSCYNSEVVCDYYVNVTYVSAMQHFHRTAAEWVVRQCEDYFPQTSRSLVVPVLHHLQAVACCERRGLVFVAIH